MQEQQSVTLSFPLGGLNESRAKGAQPENTCPACMNVRPFDPRTGRARGAQRGGLSLWNATQVEANQRIQNINHVTESSTGAIAATQIRVRTHTMAVACNGKVYGTLMVDVVASNRKLRDRAVRIVKRLTGLDDEAALAALARADGRVKEAMVLSVREGTLSEARARLRAAGGCLRGVLDAPEAHPDAPPQPEVEA